MKIITEDNNIKLVPEGYADQLYLARFYKDAVEWKNDENMLLNFTFSDERCNVNAPKGGGSCNADEIVEHLWDAEDGTNMKSKRGRMLRVAIEEIENLEISTYDV